MRDLCDRTHPAYTAIDWLVGDYERRADGAFLWRRSMTAPDPSAGLPGPSRRITVIPEPVKAPQEAPKEPAPQPEKVPEKTPA